MRIAGAGDRFPYGPAHAVYINAAKEQADAGGGPLVVTAQRPEQYAPQAGDLICLGRGGSRALTYDELPTTSFPAIATSSSRPIPASSPCWAATWTIR